MLILLSGISFSSYSQSKVQLWVDFHKYRDSATIAFDSAMQYGSPPVTFLRVEKFIRWDSIYAIYSRKERRILKQLDSLNRTEYP